MNLPASFRNITYQVAGSFTYIGDLIITDKIIYYFPHTELAGMIYKIGYLGWAIFGLLIVAITPLGLLGEGLKGVAQDKLKERLVGPNTPEGKLAREEAAKFQSWLAELENSYSKGELKAERLYPIILRPALWYPLLLDSLVAGIRETHLISMESLPEPVRFSGNMIKGISITTMGKLIIEMEFDMKHKFRIGVFRKNKARKALKEGGYIP